eukprot:6453562-Amphidinium_carterae.1
MRRLPGSVEGKGVKNEVGLNQINKGSNFRLRVLEMWHFAVNAVRLKLCVTDTASISKGWSGSLDDGVGRCKSTVKSIPTV